MRIVFLTVLLIMLPFSMAQAYTCEDKDPEKVFQESTFIGLAQVIDVIDPTAEYRSTHNGAALPGTEGVNYLILKPLYTYHGKFNFDQTKVSFLTMECGFYDFKKNQVREVVILPVPDGNYGLRDATYKLKREAWEKFRLQQNILDYITSQKSQCLKKGGTWNFPYGGIAECAE